MSNQAVPGVYTWIIDDVVTKVRPHFQSVGLSDQVLVDIEKKWKEKLIASKCATFSNLQATAQQQQQNQQQLPNQANLNNFNVMGGGQQLNQQYMGSYQNSLYQTHQQQQPHQQQNYYQDNSNADFLGTSYGLQQQHQQQQQQQLNPMNMMNFAPQMQLPPLQPYGRPNNNNLGGYQLNQNDGHGDNDLDGLATAAQPIRQQSKTITNEIDALLENGVTAALARIREKKSKSVLSTSPTVDTRNDDEGGRGVEITDVEEKKRVFERIFRNKKVAQVDGPDDDDDDDDDEDEDNNRLGSDLDTNDGDDDDDPDLNDLILCQYEKVNRTKNKWKCVFKDGIVHVNGKDYLFHKANADFEW
ncbi:transcription factor IIA, alpha/beta subunit [Obelidium mucronatum]|nr:transcription factor IIA, alpha/beta subunit [Obelidium mucronatum]